MVVGIVIPLVLAHVNATRRDEVLSALHGGRYEVIEGTVQGFHAGAASSHPPEEFDVSGHHFRYAPAELLYTFNHVAGAGGPMREGLRVRIASVEGRIARLEIARKIPGVVP
jgi:hypothetical protein